MDRLTVGASVTVVVPLYRNRSTVVAALDSVRAQTVPPDSVIVVDDGSDDGSADVVAELFPEVELVRQGNAGPAAARNVGWRRAKTEWVAFLDADDVWEPGKLARQLSSVGGRDDVVLVACDWSSPGGDGERLPVRRPVPAPLVTLSTRDLLVLNRFQTSTVVVRRRVLEAEGGFDSELDGTEDWDLWLRCSRHGTVLKLNMPLVRYRDTAGSYSKSSSRVRDSMRRMIDRELSRSSLGPARRAQVRAWHELRFMVSAALHRDWPGVAGGWAEIQRRRLVRAVPSATVRYLLPFLARRRIRRWYPVQAMRVTGRSGGYAPTTVGS